MAAEVLSYQQVPPKPEEASRPDADAASSTKRNYVPIRPAYRPLLPKPTTRDSAPSPIHIHTRTSGLSQLACRKRHSGVTTKIDAAKRRRNLATRATEHARSTAAQADAKAAESKPAAAAAAAATAAATAAVAVPVPVPGAGSARQSQSAHSSPSPSASSVSSLSAMDSPSVTSVSTRSIFGPPPPSQSMDPLAERDADAPKPPRTVSGSMTSMMSAIVNRFQQPTTQSPESVASGDSPLSSISISDVSSHGQSLFSQLPLNEFDEMPLGLDQLDAELESTVTSTASVAASLASSTASSTSDSASGSLEIASAMPEDLKKLSSASPDTFEAYGSPAAPEFDEFTDLYFHSGSQFDSVTPTDGSPDTLGDVLDTEVGLVDKNIQDDFSMMDFLAPVDLFNA